MLLEALILFPGFKIRTSSITSIVLKNFYGKKNLKQSSVFRTYVRISSGMTAERSAMMLTRLRAFRMPRTGVDGAGYIPCDESIFKVFSNIVIAT